jgi:hypothetical protein
MNGIAPVDTGYLRASVQEIGTILQNAQKMRIGEVVNLISLQAEIASATKEVQILETYISNGQFNLGSNINIIA